MHELEHSYATVWRHFRRSVESHRDWIEKRLSIRMSETVIVKTDIGFQDAAVQHVTGYLNSSSGVDTAVALLIPEVQSVEMPPLYVPILEVAVRRAQNDDAEVLSDGNHNRSVYSLDWVDGPVLMKLRSMSVAFVALCVTCIRGPQSGGEEQFRAVVISRQGLGEYMGLVQHLRQRDTRPKIIVDHDTPLLVGKCAWDDLILDQGIVSLLQTDFETFFERRTWFEKMRLPFRRGYLLHGPPGNGKTTAVRAMMTSRGLTAYTLRLFDKQVDDSDLEQVFERAARNAPAIVLLEDIDRSFPRTGQTVSDVSLRSLLNCLDGLASGQGIVTVATANEPTALDPAILRRPGRFDRVVSFPNPSAELRRRYILKMQPSFVDFNIDAAVNQSDGFSFAFLREAYIMAAQAGFESGREMTVDDLLGSVESLRHSLLFGSMKASAGFTPPKVLQRFRPAE